MHGSDELILGRYVCTNVRGLIPLFLFTSSYLYKPIKLNAMTTGAAIFWGITFTILIAIQIKVMINDKKA